MLVVWPLLRETNRVQCVSQDDLQGLALANPDRGHNVQSVFNGVGSNQPPPKGELMACQRKSHCVRWCNTA